MHCLSQLSLVLSPVGLASTLAAASASLPIDVIVWMALRAVRLASVTTSPTITPTAILPRRDKLQMIGVLTGTVAAEVIGLHPFGDRPNPQLVGKAVSGNKTIVDAQTPITVTETASPEPAAGFGWLNPLQEPFERGGPSRRTITHASV